MSIESAEMKIVPHDDGVLNISGTLDLGAAEALHNALAEYLGREPLLKLDLSGVELADTAALQLLCSAHKTAAESGRSVQVVAASAAVSNMAAALGLAPEEFACAGGE